VTGAINMAKMKRFLGKTLFVSMSCPRYSYVGTLVLFLPSFILMG